MEFKKKAKNGREIIATITVDKSRPTFKVILSLNFEYQRKKKSLFWWKNKMVTDRFEFFTVGKPIEDVNTWNKDDFEKWVDTAIEVSDDRTENYIRNQAIIKLINDEK